MKKIIIALLAGILFSLNSCTADDVEYSYSIKDALKISAWVLDENLEGSGGYWLEDEMYGSTKGYWIDENAGETLYSDDYDIFVFERLKTGEVRTLAPIHYNRETHINIFLEFDGIIEAETDDEYLVLSYDPKNPSQPLRADRSYENIKWTRELCVNILPLDEYTGSSADAAKRAIIRDTAKTGTEYYFNINAYRFENEESPIIRVRLKLAVIEDKGLAPAADSTFGVPAKERSRFLSVEMVSYEYSDIYKIMDDITDE